MVTGASALTALGIWIRTQYRDYGARRAALRARNWSAYVEPTGINDWFVSMTEEPPTLDARVVLQVLRTPDGQPDEQMAEGMRRTVRSHGHLAIAPTQAQMDFLVALRKERFGKGYPV
jgi:hypothetical protein